MLVIPANPPATFKERYPGPDMVNRYGISLVAFIDLCRESSKFDPPILTDIMYQQVIELVIVIVEDYKCKYILSGTSFKRSAKFVIIPEEVEALAIYNYLEPFASRKTDNAKLIVFVDLKIWKYSYDESCFPKLALHDIYYAFDYDITKFRVDIIHNYSYSIKRASKDDCFTSLMMYATNYTELELSLMLKALANRRPVKGKSMRKLIAEEKQVLYEKTADILRKYLSSKFSLKMKVINLK